MALPEQLGDVVHADILYGSKIAKYGIKYVLFLVDRATRYMFTYPLHSLKDDILPAFKKLFEN